MFSFSCIYSRSTCCTKRLHLFQVTMWGMEQVLRGELPFHFLPQSPQHLPYPHRVYVQPQEQLAQRIGEVLQMVHPAGSEPQTLLAFHLDNARAGDLVAQTAVGVVYLRGLLGAEVDTAQGIHWLTQAVSQDHAPAK